MGPLDGRFEVVARRRPVAIVQPGTRLAPAPYAAVEVDLTTTGSSATTGLVLGDLAVRASYDGSRVWLVTSGPGGEERHVSRRHGRAEAPTALALALTGPRATALVREAGPRRSRWVARATLDLLEPRLALPSVHYEAALATIRTTGAADRAGTFGQLGLRDLRLVTHADGTPYDEGGQVLLTATSAGPGGFRSGHLSVWALDPTTYDLAHRADLFVRRVGAGGRPGVYGDHAGHLLRDGDRWLLAASTWGDFDRDRNARVSIVVSDNAADGADWTRGTHVVDARPLVVPTDGLASVGVWDPHLVHEPGEPGGSRESRESGRWLVAFVSATRWFRFHPALAAGPTLDLLSLLGAATERRACEGVTLLEVDGRRLLAASEGPDGRRGQRATYPLLDLACAQVGGIDAVHAGNIPWPTVVPGPDGPLLVGFDGRPAGGALLGYGTHGDVLVQSTVGPAGED